jgi:putative protease
MMKTAELLAPAGNLEKLQIALHYGADAVYLGLSSFSLRARADNFNETELERSIRFTHEHNARIYVTANVFAHNRDLSALKDHLSFLETVRPDGLVIADSGVFALARKYCPSIPIHISTQANITNAEAARFWQDMGASRIVLAREVSVDEIKEIRDYVDLDLEAFVHGSVCIAYSGRCYLSSFLSNRSGNHGECANTCRWNYTLHGAKDDDVYEGQVYYLQEEKRPDEFFPIYENDRGTYVMSSRDLSMIDHLKELRNAGVNSFKIEGRMKGVNYLAGVVKSYREALDEIQPDARKHLIREKELAMFSSRGYTTGLYFGAQPDADYNHDEAVQQRRSHDFIGLVKSSDETGITISLRANLKVGQKIEFLTPGHEEKEYQVQAIFVDGKPENPARNEDEALVILDAKASPRSLDVVRSLR